MDAEKKYQLITKKNDYMKVKWVRLIMFNK